MRNDVLVPRHVCSRHVVLVGKTEGRFVRYRADMAAFNALVEFLTEDCCQGQLAACSPDKVR